ncbi:putative transcription factor interactor and regulator CCHC(Zn) family [Rosa chinensis]|uniref:Putative transcription factor interactor and regulator CCHC(Zn) family n=1 Tax=Rosa chinensis TaxID=74649 RepID=A0A2P6R6M3_ROSCH|nr:putative transcription factor interactor and regulator CCHC(Zn) family [Rosa chinensis]
MHQNMDLCLTDEQPYELDGESTEDDKKAYKDWHRANKMAKNVIRSTMSDTVRGCIEEPEYAVDFLEAIAQKFRESDKAEGARLSRKFNDLKFSGNGSVRTHIMELIDINNKLRELYMGVNDAQVVHVALESLPNAYSHLRTTYNAQKEKWTLNELISICVDEQERIKKESTPTTTVNLMGKNKGKYQNKLKPKKTITKATTEKAAAGKLLKIKCYFCKKYGHMKKQCEGFKKWMIKKGFNKEESSKEA